MESTVIGTLDGANGLEGATVRTYWNNGTNPITGLQVLANAGTILSGTCSLYGMN